MSAAVPQSTEATIASIEEREQLEKHFLSLDRETLYKICEYLHLVPFIHAKILVLLRREVERRAHGPGQVKVDRVSEAGLVERCVG